MANGWVLPTSLNSVTFHPTTLLIYVHRSSPKGRRSTTPFWDLTMPTLDYLAHSFGHKLFSLISLLASLLFDLVKEISQFLIT